MKSKCLSFIWLHIQHLYKIPAFLVISNGIFGCCDRYERATQIYQTVAKNSMNNNLLKYSVKGYLLNAGLCQICGKDIVAVQNAIESYQVGSLKRQVLILFDSVIDSVI